LPTVNQSAAAIRQQTANNDAISAAEEPAGKHRQKYFRMP